MRWLFVILCFYSPLSAIENIEDKLTNHFFHPDVTSLNVSDWYNPSVQDYHLIQNFLKKKVRVLVDTPLSSKPFPETFLNKEFYGWITYRMNCSGTLVRHDETDALPTRNIIYFNNNPDDKRRCVICYVNFPRDTQGTGRDYIRSLKFLIHALEKTKFDGHLIYYIGGWPGIEKGRLKFIDCPYGFKPFLFEEAKDLGYKNVLWLDACVIPVKNLNPVFDFIEKEGLCFYSSHDRPSWREFDKGYEYIMPSLAMPRNKPYEEISGRVIGFNMSNIKSMKLLNEWLQAAEKKLPFIMGMERVLMYMINHFNLEYGAMPPNFCAFLRLQDFAYWTQKPNIILYHDYEFLNPKIPLPEDNIFNR